MTRAHKIVLLLAAIVILFELSLFLYYHRIIFDWISHNLWIVIVPFLQRKWRWIRWSKVMFLRRGKQLFGSLNDFWTEFSVNQKRFILIAFFPIVILLFLLGLSFNVTRKTMVKKTQETALFKTAVSAGNSSKGIQAWIARLDHKILEQIKALTSKK